MTDEQLFLAKMRDFKAQRQGVKQKTASLAMQGKIKEAERRTRDFNMQVETSVKDLNIPEGLRASTLATMIRPPKKR